VIDQMLSAVRHRVRLPRRRLLALSRAGTAAGNRRLVRYAKLAGWPPGHDPALLLLQEGTLMFSVDPSTSERGGLTVVTLRGSLT
jgi:hypothetical protein